MKANQKPIEIRLMEDSDLEKVGQIFLISFNAVGEEWMVETASQHVKEAFFEGFHYVALSEDQIVGFILAIPLTREKGTELFIDSIAVLPEYQNNGVGKILWDRIVEDVKTNKFVGIRLLTNPHLESYKWYKQMGFEDSSWIEVFKEY